MVFGTKNDCEPGFNMDIYVYIYICILTARISCLPASATPLVSEWCKCTVNSGISGIVAVYVP